MRAISGFADIFLCREPVDFRKSVNGLVAIVIAEMREDPRRDSLFVFTNKTRKLIKILYWDTTGFAYWYKRLEKDKFIWPKHLDLDVVIMTTRQLELLLEGIDVWKMKPHREVHYEHFL